jgi:hypothetical protein
MIALGDVDVLVLPAERGGEVTLAGVADDGHDGRQFRVPSREFQSGGHVAAARDAAEDPLLRGEGARRPHGFGRGGRDDAGEERDIEVSRHEPIADALDAVMAPLAASEECALCGLDRVQLDCRVAPSQVAAHAGEKSTAPLRIHERPDGAPRLFPHLRAGGRHVRSDIVRVVKLAGHPVAAGGGISDLVEPLQREIDVALATGSEDEAGPVGAHDLLAFLAHALRHDDGAGVALDRGDPRAGDSGVTRRALEHLDALPEVPPALGRLEHVEIDAVLEAAGGPIPFDLDVNGWPDPGGDAVEPDERRVPDRSRDGRQSGCVAIPGDCGHELLGSYHARALPSPACAVLADAVCGCRHGVFTRDGARRRRSTARRPRPTR